MPWYQNRDGEQLWYEDAGCGMPLIFLHGWCMSSTVWQRQFGCLQRKFRLIAPDLRGHGFSQTVTGQADFEHFSADLCDLVQYLELENIILIGWSMGAQIALQAYHHIAGSLAGLVLVSATPSFTVKDDYKFGLTANEAAGMRLKVERNIGRALSGFHARMFAQGELESLHLADQAAELLASVVLPDTAVAIASLDALVSADMRPLLAEISIPIMILNGDRDPICLPQASAYLSQHIIGSQRMIFYGCGHAPFITRAEQFNNEIIRFAGSVCGRIA